MSEQKLTRVTFDFEDGTAVYLDGKDAAEWDSKIGGSGLHKRQKSCEPYEELEAEFKRLNEIHIHGCECGTDDVCEFARQRDKARTVVREMLEMLRKYRDETHHRLAAGCTGEMLQRLDERWLVANTLITRCEHIAQRHGLEVE